MRMHFFGTFTFPDKENANNRNLWISCRSPKEAFLSISFSISLFQQGSIVISTDGLTGKLSTTNFHSTMCLKDSFDCGDQDHSSGCLGCNGLNKATLIMKEYPFFCDICQFSGRKQCEDIKLCCCVTINLIWKDVLRCTVSHSCHKFP